MKITKHPGERKFVKRVLKGEREYSAAGYTLGKPTSPAERYLGAYEPMKVTSCEDVYDEGEPTYTVTGLTFNQACWLLYVNTPADTFHKIIGVDDDKSGNIDWMEMTKDFLSKMEVTQ